MVITTIKGSVQLRKKLCYFMIMVLSCCDLLTVLTNNPLIVVFAMMHLTEKLDLKATWPYFLPALASAFQGFSLLALLVMSLDRYLATSYPLFHRTSVTKTRLLILLAILIIIVIALAVISSNESIIPFHLYALAIFLFLTLPMLFINYKLFLVVRKNRRNDEISPERKKMISLTKISKCMMVVACYVVLSIPVLVYIGIKMNSRDRPQTFGYLYLAGIWGKTITLMNCTFNCLIFYWKNKVLRTEGLKVLKSIKILQRVRSVWPTNFLR